VTPLAGVPPEAEREANGHGAAGERIRRLRLERGLSQSELGQPRLSKGFISQVESGRSRPSPESLRFIAARLGVPLLALLPGMGASHQRAFMLRAASAAVAAGQHEQATSLLDEVEPLLDSALDRGAADRLRGEALLLGGDLDGALDRALAAHAAADPAEAVEEAARACALVGRIHATARRWPAALVYLEQAAQLAGSSQVPAALRALVQLTAGAVHGELGDMARAIRCYEAARAAAAEADDLDELARAHTGLAEAARRRGDLASAIAHGERAATLLERLEMRRLQVRLLHGLGGAHAAAGDRAAARAYEKRALTAAEALGDAHTAAGARERIAALELLAGHPAAAYVAGEEAVRAARAVRDDGLLLLALVGLAEACEALGDAERTDRLLVEARAGAGAAGAAERRQALLREGALRRARGDHEAAADCYEAAARLSV
jgi:transcriptional regulator with XRE-family HTH domain